MNSTADAAANLAAADRLTRAAAADGARLIVLPGEVDGDRLGGATARGGARRSTGRRSHGRARAPASWVWTWWPARSRSAGWAQEKLANTSVHVDPSGEIGAVYRKVHMFDVEIDGRSYSESEVEQAGDEIVSSETGDGVELGLAICYDLRFPELFRILAVRGARVIVLPSAFTLPTTRDHWETLIRARAIENQAFVIAANQIGPHPGGQRSGGRSMIVDPWGVVLAQAPDREGYVVAELDLEYQREVRAKLPSLANRRPAAYRWPVAKHERVGRHGAPDKRRLILNAAVRVFARQGFHACRVSDIADEAGVAYGFVYHYFASKDEILDTLFLERWNVMLELIREVDSQPLPVREKLGVIASFIVDSYRHDPDLMKVIIVEVTRAANSFGQTHLGQIREAYELIGEIVIKAQADGVFKVEIDAQFAAMAFYGAIEQMLTGWIFGLLPEGEEHFERAKWLVVETVCGGLETSAVGEARVG